MKKHNDQPLDEVLKGMMRTGVLKNGFYDTQIKKIWEEKLGKLLINKTEKIHFAKGIIYLKLNSSALRQELLMGKKQLIGNFNREIGEEIVQDIVLR